MSGALAVVDPARPDLGGNLRDGDPLTWSPALWAWLVDRFGVGSVLDVGCGEGHAVRYFARRLGVIAHGIDGLELNVRRAVHPIARHDLAAGAYLMPVDMAWSCEVAEHIDPEHVGHFVDTLANGRLVAMTYAVPGQAGHHHVNCQPEAYWVAQLARRGYRPAQRQDVERARSIATAEGAFYFGRTGLLFHRAR